MILVIALLLIGIPVFADGPAYRHEGKTQEEFQILYNEKADKRTTPKIYTSTSTPTFAPSKYGDIFVNTTSGKVYIASGTSNSGSWAILN